MGRFWIVLVLVACFGSAQAVPISGQGTWQTTLLARDFDGNTATVEGWYDTVLDITWLSYTDPTVVLDQASAMAYASSLTIAGVTGWRLPTVSPVNGSTFNITPSNDGSTDRGYNIGATGSAFPGSTASEMAHLFYVTLGNTPRVDLTGTTVGCPPAPAYCLTNTGLFSNLLSNEYWSQTVSVTNSSGVATGGYSFAFNIGQQQSSGVSEQNLVLAVHSGSVGSAIGTHQPVSVPEPNTLTLLGAGLIGVRLFTRRRWPKLAQTPITHR